MCHDLPNIKGHSFHIGGTLHYLLLGTPFEVIKTMGQWSGESFTLYLCKHAVIHFGYSALLMSSQTDHSCSNIS
ncbi:hypothetical protein ID866_7851 [Astraeus odoratus]|nr:hypothetical protein ID866_7851 [Astraeus odoratus]